MPSTSSIVGGMKMTKKMHLADLHGLEDTVGSGILRLMVSIHMGFIATMSKAVVDSSFAQVMMTMNQRLSSVMLFVGTITHIIGLLSLTIFKERIPNVLILKALDTGVMKQTMRTTYPLRQSYLWHGRPLD